MSSLSSVVQQGSSSDGWWNPRDTFAKNSQERLSILVNGTRLSYTSTYGSYYNPQDANGTIGEGWLRFDEENPLFGMRAIAFAHLPSSRVLIAYRGTDTDVSGISGQADICADAYLFGPNISALPPFCSRFNDTTLDYMDAARRFALRVQFALPFCTIMYTGHSLGAALAAGMALYRLDISSENRTAPCAPVAVAGAVVFAAPDYLFVLATRSWVPIANVTVGLQPGDDMLDSKILVLADVYDPVQATAQLRPARGMVGTLCYWNISGPPSAECVACFTRYIATQPDAPDCIACLLQRHVFSHYEQLVASRVLPNCSSVQACRSDPAGCQTVPSDRQC